VKRIGTATRLAASFTAMAFVLAGPAFAQTAGTTPAAEEDITAPWSAGRDWLSIRAGYNKSMIDSGAHGSVGAGIGFSHMMSKMKVYKWTLFKQFSFGAYAHVEQVGRFADAAEIEVPVTVELVRHFEMGSQYFRPYVGFGGGSFYRKLYRTGEDYSVVRPGGYLVIGANTPVDHRHVIGLDARLIRLDASNDPPNPVFGAGDDTAGQWSVKLNYALTY